MPSLSFIRQTRLPPKVVECVRGTHLYHNESIATDFELFLNVTPYIARDRSGSWNSVKLACEGKRSQLLSGVKVKDGLDTVGLGGWAQWFCEDPAR